MIDHDPYLMRFCRLGFDNFISIQDFATSFPLMYPSKTYDKGSKVPEADKAISAVVILQAPTDWGEALQIVCDVIRMGGRVHSPALAPFSEDKGQAVEVLIANPDFSYAAEFPHPRMTSGAFRICLETLFKVETGRALEYTLYGKPHRLTYDFALRVLGEQKGPVDRVYAIGDNPKSDIRGARDMGWCSILTCTGCFERTKLNQNDSEYPADRVCESVVDAVDFILNKENIK